MPEYFDITLILRKDINHHKFLKTLTNTLSRKQNHTNEVMFLVNKSFLVTKIENDNTEFVQIIISVSDVIFHKDYFNEEYKLFSNFVDDIFCELPQTYIVLCSYELNVFLLGGIEMIDELNFNNLGKFPFVFVNSKSDLSQEYSLQLKCCNGIINYAAQDFFE